jgi:hypothetical protein
VSDDAERRLHEDLLERARRAIVAARRLVGEADTADVMAHLQRGHLGARCAWCGRYRVGDRWVRVARELDESSARVTHGICPDCVAALRDAGRSV